MQTDPDVHSEGYIWGTGKTVVGTWGFPFSELNVQAWWGAEADPYFPDWKSFVKTYFTPARPAAAWKSSVVAWEPADQTRPVTACFSGSGAKGSVAGLRFTSNAVAPQDLGL